MKNFLLVCLALVTLVAGCFAGTAYVVTNNDNANGNSATIYSMNTTTGALTHLMDLPTNGFGSNGGYFATVGNSAAVTGEVGCLLVYDSGSSDVASFNVNLRTLNVSFVGNFTNSALISTFPGGSISVTPNGKFAYVTYALSENIGAWAIKSDCSLSFIAAYQASAGADEYDGLKVTPDGKNLLVSVPDLSAVEQFSINQTTGVLNDLGSANFGGLTDCINDGCFPAGIDITADSKGAIIGNFSLTAPSVLAAAITPAGPKNPTFFPLSNTGSLTPNVNVPFLSASAYRGSGPLYLSLSGTGAGSVPGVATATLSEAHKTITGKASTTINSPNGYDGLIASSGNLLVVSIWFNQLQVFTINADGTLTPTAQGPVTNAQADGAYSFFIYPNSR